MGSCSPDEREYVPATVEKETWVNKSYILELRMNDGKKYTKIVTNDHAGSSCCPYSLDGYRPEKHIPLDFLDNIVQQGTQLRVWKEGVVATRADGIGYLCTAAILVPDQPNVEQEKK